MTQVDSQQQQLPTYEIIQHSLDATGHQGERGAHMRRLAAAMQHPNMHVHQFGNTVFMALEARPGTALLSMHNADTPRNMVANTVRAMHWLRNDLGLRQVVFSTKTPSIRTLAQMMVAHAGLPGMRLEDAPGGREILYLGH
jgi:hypothetical protein